MRHPRLVLTMSFEKPGGGQTFASINENLGCRLPSAEELRYLLTSIDISGIRTPDDFIQSGSETIGSRCFDTESIHKHRENTGPKDGNGW